MRKVSEKLAKSIIAFTAGIPLTSLIFILTLNFHFLWDASSWHMIVSVFLTGSFLAFIEFRYEFVRDKYYLIKFVIIYTTSVYAGIIIYNGLPPKYPELNFKYWVYVNRTFLVYLIAGFLPTTIPYCLRIITFHIEKGIVVRATQDIIGVFVGFVLLFYSVNTVLTPGCLKTKPRACIANLELIQDAANKYILDTGISDGLKIEQLLNDSISGWDGPYLRSIPINPINGKSDYILKVQNDSIYVGVLDITGRSSICCLEYSKYLKFSWF